MNRRDLFHLACAATALAFASAGASQAQVGEQPIRIIYPYAPGGSGDTLTRLVGDKMQAAFNRNVIVENRTGGAGRIGVQAVKNAAPDGATLLVTPIAPMSVFQFVYKELEYDPIKDFAAVSQLATFDFGIAVNAQVPVKSIKELVAWAKANPTEANYGIPAAGSLPHFLGVMLGRAANIDLRPVPYRGTALILKDLLAGHVPMTITIVSDLIQSHKAGKIRVLATFGKQRSSFLPDVPTLREAGYDLQATSWFGMFAPAKTPREVIERYSKVVAAAVQAPDVAPKLRAVGLIPTGTTAAELAKIQKEDAAFWGRVVKASGFKPR